METESFTWPKVLYHIRGFYINKIYFIGIYPCMPDDDPIANRSAFYVIENFYHAVLVRQGYIDDKNFGYFTDIEEAKGIVRKKIGARIKELKCQK